jgi:hypothetical protein
MPCYNIILQIIEKLCKSKKKKTMKVDYHRNFYYKFRYKIPYELNKTVQSQYGTAKWNTNRRRIFFFELWGFFPKDQNRAAGAQFWACCRKWQPGAMGGGSGVVCIRQWWWWGGAFANCEAEEGVGAKNPKPSRRGSISGAPCQTAV